MGHIWQDAGLHRDGARVPGSRHDVIADTASRVFVINPVFTNYI